MARNSEARRALTYAQLGQLTEARAHVAEVLRVEPNFAISRTAWRIVRFKSAKDNVHLFEGLRKAGFPE
jgi:hypothetical protein